MPRPLLLPLLLVPFTTGCGNTKTAPPDAGESDLATATVTATATATATVTATATATASASGAALADAVTHASTKYDPAPTVIASGKVDGAALRKRHIERLKSDHAPVTVIRGETALELGQRICEAAAPRRPPETPVLLKPNLCGFDSIKDPAKHGGDDGVHGRSTDVEFTRGVIHCLKARGHKKITVAEGCGISHKHWQDVIALTGYDVMAREEGVSLVAMDDDGVFDVEGDAPGKPLAISGIEGTRVPTLLLPKVLAEHLDHGLFLSLPKIKAHRYSVVSLGIKGMQGTVMLSDKAPAYKQKWRMHKELGDYLDQRKEAKAQAAQGGGAPPPDDRALYVATLTAFAERMVDTLEISTPDAVLLEGAPAMGGDGFQALRPSTEKVAIGGTNPVLVDRAGAAFLGLFDHPGLARELGGHRTSPLIEIAARRYKLDLKAAAITGDGADLLSAPRPFHFKAMAPFSLDWDPPGVKTPAAPVWASLLPPGSALARAPGDAVAPAMDTMDRPQEAPAPAADKTAQPAPPAPSAAPKEASPPAATGKPEAARPDAGKPEAHAAPLGADALILDGKIDEAAWGRAKAVTWETDYAGKSTGISTRVRFLWDRSALYALIELAGTGLHVDTSLPVTEERKGLYNEDCAEIFLTPDPGAPRHYYEVELGPFGHFFDIEIDRDKGKQNIAWSSGLTVGTHRDPGAHTARIEAKITAPAITSALAPGARLPLGLYRMEGKGDRHYLAWSPPRTAKPNFHVPEAFGKLVLDP